MSETRASSRVPRAESPQPGGASAQRQRPQSPPTYRSSVNDEILRNAMQRADEAFEMLGRLEARNQRERRVRTVRRSIEKANRDREKARVRAQGLFFANFFLLALVFVLGAGPFTNNIGEVLAAIARACALVGTYLLLVQLLLVSRIPYLDQIWGHDKMTQIHKVNGHISFDLIMIHAVAVVVARAWLNDVSLPVQFANIMQIRFMPHAIVGTAMLMIAIATSAHAARRKVGHDKWHFLHKWTYLGTLLSFGHMLNGPDFFGKPISQGYMWFLFIATFGLIFHYRIAIPVKRAFKHQLQVRKVVEEAPGITSVYMTGFRLKELKAKAGQFCYWRFLTRGHWNSAHPYSLSVAPNEKFLRITVKDLGDHSSGLKSIPLGTWVTFEGPFGRFTADKRTKMKTLLIAGGIGVTPIRSLLEGMEFVEGDLAVVYRASKEADAVLLNEIEEIASAKGAELHLVLGSSSSYETHNKPLGPNHLRGLIPDIAHRDIFICASPPMTQSVRATLKQMGVHPSQVHFEAFA